MLEVIVESKPLDPAYYDILKVIQNYYPVGLPYTNKDYPGYAELEQLLEDKANRLISGQYPEPWTTICRYLQERYPDDHVYNHPGIGDPSYMLMVPVRETVDTFIKRRISISACLSLLGPYYTVYLQDDILYEPNLGKLAVHFIRPDLTPEESEMIDTIKAQISLHYPAYKFFEYQRLQRKVSGAIPIGADSETLVTEHPLYAFLFEYQLIYGVSNYFT